VPNGLERIACFNLDKKRVDAVRFLQEHTNDNELIFSGLTRHDKIFVNDMMLYFVARRKPATKWDLFAPGLQTTAGVQKEIVSELEIKKPHFIVLESDWDNVREPNDSAVTGGGTVLDAYIQKQYDLAAGFGSVNVMERREQSIQQSR
jgi:hypothetical protein